MTSSLNSYTTPVTPFRSFPKVNFLVVDGPLGTSWRPCPCLTFGMSETASCSPASQSQLPFPHFLVLSTMPAFSKTQARATAPPRKAWARPPSAAGDGLHPIASRAPLLPRPAATELPRTLGKSRDFLRGAPLPLPVPLHPGGSFQCHTLIRPFPLETFPCALHAHAQCGSSGRSHGQGHGLALGLMLCYSVLKLLVFEQGTPTSQFALGPASLVTSSASVRSPDSLA